MGQAVPVDDLPGSLVPETDLPTAGVAENDLFKSGQPGVPSTNPPVPGMPAPQFYPVGPGANMPSLSGAYNTAKTIAGPVVGGVANTLGTYAKNPVAALTDLTASHFGLPPPVAATQITPGIQESYQQVKDYISKTGNFKPTTLTGGANPAVDTLMNTPHPNATPIGTPTPPVVGGPAAQEGSTFISRMAEKFAPMAARVAPVLNTVGRVAGPAGLALNAYEGAKFAQEAELGKRLAEGQGGVAQHAFRNMNTQYGAPISREQAITVLQSGNPRDIAAFGGEQHLRQLAQ